MNQVMIVSSSCATSFFHFLFTKISELEIEVFLCLSSVVLLIFLLLLLLVLGYAHEVADREQEVPEEAPVRGIPAAAI